MSSKYILLSALIIASVLSSGCLFDNDEKTAIGPDFIPKTNLPSGFTFMGVHETAIDVGNSTITGFEGVYRFGGKDIYVAAYNNESPGTLLDQYKKDLRKHFREDFNPFEEISINGHPATKFNDIIIVNGNQEWRYSIFWAKEDYMVLVGSFDDAMAVVSLASATGY